MILRTLTRTYSRLEIQHTQTTLTRRQLICTCHTHNIHCHSATTTAAHRPVVSSCHPSVSSFLRVSSWLLFRGYRPPRRGADDEDDTLEDGNGERDIADDGYGVQDDVHEKEQEVDTSRLTKAERLKLKQKEKNRQKQILRGRSAKKDKEKFKKLEMGNDIDVDVGHTAEAAISEESKQAFARLRREKQAEEEQQRQHRQSLSGKAAHAPLGPGQHRFGDQIECDPIILLGPDKKKIGLVVLSAALKKAHENGLEVVQLTPDNVRPAVCRVVDLQDFLYEERLKELKQAESEQPLLKVKTMQMRKNIAINDYRVKLRQMEDWLSIGHPVKFMYFEMHPVEAEMQAMFKRVQHDLETFGSAQTAAEGTTAMMFMPKKQRPEQDTVAMQQQAPEQAKRASKLSREQAEPAHMAQSQ